MKSKPASLVDSGTPNQKRRFTTISGNEVDPLYTARPDHTADTSKPGQFPFTRGIYPQMYRHKLWTMRQFSGFGSAGQTNRRFRFLLDQGQDGLSVAFDLPTLMGMDSDHPLAAGEVGKCGVAIDSLRDMEELFEAIPLDRISTSMTINSPAATLLAMYVAVAQQQGVARDAIRGTLQNDILKEYIAQKEWIYPPKPSMRLVVDSIRFCTRELPLYNGISISGYHIREAGATAAQELGFTLRNGIEYVQWLVESGLDVDEFAPRLSFFFNAHSDFFEEVAKFRAARRLWARLMRDRFGASKERSWMCRFHTQTAGCSLTAQQPHNNIVRTTIQALAGVLGGTNSLHTNSYDEALALPTSDAALLALRTQQVIARESEVTNTVDPLGGSFFVEALTDRLERQALETIEKIDRMGGMIAAIENGFPQREIAEASYAYQQALETGEKTVVGVNRYVSREDQSIPTLKIGDDIRKLQEEKLRRLKRERDSKLVKKCLATLRQVATGDRDLMPPILDAVQAYATVGEISDALKDVFGAHVEPNF